MQKRQAPADLNSVKRGYTFCTRTYLFIIGIPGRSGASTVAPSYRQRERASTRLAVAVAVTPHDIFPAGNKVSCARRVASDLSGRSLPNYVPYVPLTLPLLFITIT